MLESTAIRFRLLRGKVSLKPGNCWSWTRAVRGDGYGQFRWIDGVDVGAHVAAMLIASGRTKRPEPGVVVAHSCDNPLCVRPSHLRFETQSGNIAEAARKGRLAIANVGEQHAFARLSEADVLRIRDVMADVDKGSRRSVYKLLADEFGVALTTVKNAALGYTWKHLPTPKREVA